MNKKTENDDLLDLKNKLEEDLNQLKENVYYGQELIKIGSWTYNPEINETFWSDEIYNILECSIESLGRKLESINTYIHPEDLDEVLKEIEDCLEGKEYDIEYRIVTPKGTRKYVHEKAKVIYDENNNMIKVIGIIQDITNRKIIENGLKEFGEDLIKAQRVAGIGSWKYDIVKDKLFWSEEIYRIYNIDYTSFDVSIKSVLELIHPEDKNNVQNEINKALGGKSYKLEYRIPQKDGSQKHAITKGQPLFNENGEIIGILGTLQDITEKRILNRQIEYKQEEIDMIHKRFKVLIQESNDVFKIIEPDGTIKYISESIEKIAGYKPENMIGENIYSYYEGKELQQITKMMELVLSDFNKEVKEDIVFKTKTGKEIYLEMHMKNLLDDPSINGIATNFRDITGRIEMEKRIIYISNHDKLTGLPNNIFCTKQIRLQLQHSMETNTKFAFMMLDLTGLKHVNYSLGYNLGDELIIVIVEKLKKYLSENQFISRYSGDQFAIIVQDTKTYKGYENIAKDIINLFSQAFRVKSYELNVKVNIGICICPDDTDDVNLVSQQAKMALLRSKKEGKNTYNFYSSGLDIQNYKDFVLRSDLHSAIEKDQLIVYYQPIINLKTNEILGAEALVRWEHPEWGMILPDEFISVAEETGLIIDIGKWVLRQVCNNYNKWINNGLPKIKLAVNVSGIQFLEKDFINNIKTIIGEHRLEPNFLMVEITESVLMKDVDKIISDIQELKSMGIQVALDDFGTGFSSLTYLTSFDVDIIKLDRSFIRDIPLNGTSTAITRSIIKLSKELNIKMVAEGIENYEELTHLKSLNCYAGQGYIYSKPLPLEDFEKILAKRKCKPILFSNLPMEPQEERRRFFRVRFFQLLETELTILEIKGKKINIGNTKVLIKDIGPGGLSFISNIRFPVERDILLQFTTELIGRNIKVYGHPIRIEEIDDNIYEYGLEFTIDENQRGDLIGDLNQVQIKLRQNISFAEGNFISGSYKQYFKK